MTINALMEEISQIDSITNIAAFKASVNHHYQFLNEQFDQVHVDELVTARSDLVDALLCKAWSLLSLDQENKLTLCAVGGYGPRRGCHAGCVAGAE